MARALEDAGADLLACADIEEGAALRAAGVRADILIFGALSVSDLDGLFDCTLTPPISTPGAPRSLTVSYAASSEKTLGIMLVIATIGVPVVLTYTTVIYWIFRGKVRLGSHSY